MRQSFSRQKPEGGAAPFVRGQAVHDLGPPARDV